MSIVERTESREVVRERRRRLTWGLLAALSLPAWAAAPQITCDALRLVVLNRDPSLIIVDVRPTDAFAQGHIQGARNIVAKDVATSALPLDSHIVVYCTEAACPISARAAQSLIDAGYKNVALLEGGYSEWLKRGYPTVAGSQSNITADQPHLALRDARAALANGTAVAVDVRPSQAYAAGHAPGALNAPLETLDSNLINLPRDKQLIVYDQTSARVQAAVAKLTAAGFNAKALNGGVAALLASVGTGGGAKK